MPSATSSQLPCNGRIISYICSCCFSRVERLCCMTQTAEAPQLAELVRENARLKKVVAHYQEIDQAQKQVIADLRKRIKIRTISNKKYSANEKLFLDAAH